MRQAIRWTIPLLAALVSWTAHPDVVQSESQNKERAARQETDRASVPRIAAIVTVYRQNSHADMFVSRILEGYGLLGKPPYPKLQLASLYTDQTVPNDLSNDAAAKHGFRLCKTVAEALTLGTDRLAVDGVLLIAEHGRYPESETGQTIYPKRRLFEQVVQVFEQSRRVVPVFVDKHLADNWQDARWLYDEAQRLDIPLMAGSSVPMCWRDPPADVPRGSVIREIVGVSYGPLDAYGFHGLEMVQSLAERRRGGETGVASVRCLTGEAVWIAGEEGVYDRRLLKAALACLKYRPLPEGAILQDRVKEPVAFIVDYRDGLRVSLLTLNGAVSEWAAAWRDEGGDVDATVFAIQQERPYDHFTHLLKGIEQMMHTGRPAWPVERTLYTSGILDAALISKVQGGKAVKTPWLEIAYTSEWDWKQPPPPHKSHEAR